MKDKKGPIMPNLCSTSIFIQIDVEARGKFDRLNFQYCKFKKI